MDRKRLKIGLIVTFVLVIIVSIVMSEQEEEVEVVHSDIDSNTGVSYQNLDDLIKDSVIIVSGIVRDVSDFDTTTKEYLFSVDEQLKGRSASNQIYIYQHTPIFDIGQEYVLFLSRWEGGLYPEPVHTVINTPNLITIDDNNINHNFSFLGSDLSKDNLFHAIQTSSFIRTIPTYMAEDNRQSRMPLELDSMEEIAQASDVIARVAPSFVGSENKYFKRIGVDLLELFQGDSDVTERLDKEAIIYVPQSIQLEEEYIIFLSEHDDIYQVTTRDGSVISIHDQEQWHHAMSIIGID